MAMYSRSQQRAYFFVIILFSLASAALIATSVGTESWLQSTLNRTGAEGEDGMMSKVNLGVFLGNGSFHRGVLGWDNQEFRVVCGQGWCMYSSAESKDGRKQELDDEILKYENNTDSDIDYHHYGLFGVAMYVLLFIFGGIAVIWAFVSATFALINIVTKPIETINGPLGLFAWNGLGLFFTVASLFMYVGIFTKDLKNGFLPSEYDRFRIETCTVSWSFYIMIGAVACFAVNIVLVFLSGVDFEPMCRRKGSISGHEYDNPDMIMF